ncbi:aminotransferase class V-fold PLP-dependent enzyme, partial [Paratractidigestivibacter sp.]|uniref:aminotransferase class V-fold PLP-dependent enzyme n=1 Tax=Paratractidigestivibacter sp. TaxID=2847316 RepID=UPI0040294B0F
MTRREVVYLDNAATSLWRPPEVVDAVCRALTSMGNAGRGATAESLDAARVVESCREEAARLFGCGRADHVCFTANSTEALNIAIQGLVGEGDRVVT